MVELVIALVCMLIILLILLMMLGRDKNKPKIISEELKNSITKELEYHGKQGTTDEKS